MADPIFESPEARVRAYISDLYLQWLAARDSMGSGPFDYDPVAFQKWNEACKEVHQRHFTPDAPKDEFGFGFSWSQLPTIQRTNASSMSAQKSIPRS
ncbi:hypothetical protein [Verrucomicrobium spinosum]|uniref:hypothetical protein n=1 Tax=Verrucomicrobium spinosum TaxID=2736 RepID=UPI000946470F|nr:hypothetical protein [Verrucomicrobium spinosum]